MIGPAQGFSSNRLSMQKWWITATVVGIALAALPFMVRLDGRPHADWQQFFGRFHPAIVHLPIGLIVLVPLLELAGRFKPALREASSFVLTLAFISSLLSVALGFLLAYGSGATGVILTRHMWGGITLSVLLLFCAISRPAWISPKHSALYPCLLCCGLLALLWTAHHGGSITHGSDYLTRFMPPALAPWKHPATASAAGSFFEANIHPLLDRKCVSCHGESKSQGGLRLDSYEQLRRGGKDGAVVIPGNPGNSLLLQRVSLAPADPHFMPAEGRPPLQAGEVEAIRAWIQQGASPSLPAMNGAAASGPSGDPPPHPVGDYSALLPEISRMQQAQGAKLMPVSANPADGLVLLTIDSPAAFNDQQLAGLIPFAPYIVEADLARTSITDAAFAILSKFNQLRALHLEGTSITGANLALLKSLTQLTYLNLSETRVDTPALLPLKSMPNLRHVYVFATPADAHPPEVEQWLR